MSDRRRRKASGIVSPIAFAAFPCSYADSGMNVLVTLKRRCQLMANTLTGWGTVTDRMTLGNKMRVATRSRRWPRLLAEGA